MNQKSKLPIEQIAKIADDIRLIQDFAENHNFDSGLLNANVIPKRGSNSKKWDWSLICMFAFLGFVVLVLALLKFSSNLSEGASSFLFLLGVLFGTLATMCTHMRFQDRSITIIVAIGVFLVLFIGAGIFTPKEAIENIKDIGK